MDNVANYCQATRPQKSKIASDRRCATIRMGSGGVVWAKPPNTQCIDCLAFENILRAAVWLRFRSARRDE
eukprot:4913976-Amphidinium_carterae.1